MQDSDIIVENACKAAECLQAGDYKDYKEGKNCWGLEEVCRTEYWEQHKFEGLDEDCLLECRE